MDTAHLFLRLLALSQVVLLSLIMVINQRHVIGRLLALLLISFSCYLMAPFVDPHRPEFQVVLILATAIPSFLWLLAHYFFSDNRQVPLWFWLTSIAYIGLSVASWNGLISIFNSNLEHMVFGLFPQLIKLGLVCHVFYIAIEGRANDLINQRLKLRVPIALGGSVLTALVILVEISSQGPVPMLVEVLASGLLLAICLGTNLFLLSFRDSALLLNSDSVTSDQIRQISPSLLGENSVDIQRIDQAMTGDRFYATHGATLGDLSGLLSIVEHRLRPMINQEMGFRNFNQFLNNYRINEASNRLLTDIKIPIITIALDVGFKSLSSFNKAFKDKHGKTPSEYRLNAK